jgi:hypothetical protein
MSCLRNLSRSGRAAVMALVAGVLTSPLPAHAVFNCHCSIDNPNCCDSADNCGGGACNGGLGDGSCAGTCVATPEMSDSLVLPFLAAGIGIIYLRRRARQGGLPV